MDCYLQKQLQNLDLDPSYKRDLDIWDYCNCVCGDKSSQFFNFSTYSRVLKFAVL